MEIQTSGIGVLIGMLLLLSSNIYKKYNFRGEGGDHEADDGTGTSHMVSRKGSKGLPQHESDLGDSG